MARPRARRRTRRNPRIDPGKIVIFGALAAAATSSSIRNAIGGAVGGLFHSAGTDLHGQAPKAAAAATTASGVSGNAVQLMQQAQAAGITDGTDPRSIPYGRALWGDEHGGDDSAYNGQSQAVQVNWNNVAIKGH